MSALLGLLPLAFQALLPKLVPSIMNLADKYLNKEITKAEFEAELSSTIVGSVENMHVADTKALASTFDSFMTTMKASPMMRFIWGVVVLSQLGVLLWHQVGIPAIVAMGVVRSYPPSGSTVEWAYLLLAFCLGAGPAIFRNGPAQGGGMQIIRNLIR